MIHFSPVEHHIGNRAHRLCDGRSASDTDVSSENWFARRDARRDAILCPDCQDQVNSRDVRSDLYGYDLIDFMQKMISPVPPRRVPSGAECGFCELTKGDCSERVDAGVDAA